MMDDFKEFLQDYDIALLSAELKEMLLDYMIRYVKGGHSIGFIEVLPGIRRLIEILEDC